MKNLFKFAIAITAIALVSLWSCTKEEVQEQTTESTNVEQRILSFNTKVKSSEKSNETMSVEDAIWNVEASFNYNYGETQIDYAELYTDSAFFTVNTINGCDVDFDDVQNLYNECLDVLTSFYNSIEGEDVHCKLIDLEILDFGETEIAIKMEYQMGIRNMNKSTNWLQSFGSTDYWKYGWGLGKCNGFSGNGDAAMLFQNRINNEYIQAWGTYYTDYLYKNKSARNYPNPNDDIMDNLQDYLMFSQTKTIPNWDPQVDNNYSLCIDPNDMNFYMRGIKNVMLYNKPAGLSFVSVEIQARTELIQTLTVPDDGDEQNEVLINGAFHFARFKYAIKHITKMPRLKSFAPLN